MSTCREEIDYMMDCADLDRDGRLDYMEFTHRFHTPAEQIGRDEVQGLIFVLFDFDFVLLTLHSHFLG